MVYCCYEKKSARSVRKKHSLKGKQMKNTTLTYNTPAEVWTEALPLGNGRLGAMIYGGVSREEIRFNEETFWSLQIYIL